MAALEWAAWEVRDLDSVGAKRMLLFENIGLALIAIRSNISRSILTMLGIIIGVASVIGIMTIGNALSTYMDNIFADGLNFISVGVSQKQSDDATEEDFMAPPREMSNSDYLTTDMIEDVLDVFDERISGVNLNIDVFSEAEAIKDGVTAAVAVAGYNETGFKKLKWDKIAGREFYSEEYNEDRNICYVSSIMVDKIFNGDYEGVINQELSVLKDNVYYTYRIVGVYEDNPEDYGYDSADSELETTIYIPLRAAMRQNHTYDKFESVDFIAEDYSECDALGTDICKYLNNRYYKHNPYFEATSFSFGDMVEEITGTLNNVRMGLAAIAGISLLVGGIGVMNIMLVSITERTREIGTRKALGATNVSIRTQFIVESIVLCLVGGLIGIILGLLLGYAGCNAMNVDYVVSPMSIVIAIGFSAAVGVFFGYYPANKAATMNPIDALRFE